MFLICDKNDLIQDMASEKANLSRGYGFEDYKLYEVKGMAGAAIGDTFKDGILIKNDQLRYEIAEKAETERKIHAKARAVAIAECIKDGDLPPDFKDTK